MGKDAILLISFGTTYDETREKTINNIEKAISEKYPSYALVQAYTSSMIIRSLSKRGMKIFNVKEALQKLVDDGIENLHIQSTHIICGDEYEKMLRMVSEYEDKFKTITVGKPLFADHSDVETFTNIISKAFPLEEDEALVLMGHGTEHEINKVYEEIKAEFDKKGFQNILVGTVEAKPDIEDIIEALKEMKPKKVKLTPLMLVAGDHATNDMAGDEDDSWKTIIANEGIEVEVILKGLGEYEEIRTIYMNHLEESMKQ